MSTYLFSCSGKPKPIVEWWKDGELLDGVMDTPSVIGTTSKFTVNQLFISKVTKSLWGTKLECRARFGTLENSKSIIREVPLDIYRELFENVYLLVQSSQSVQFEIRIGLFVEFGVDAIDFIHFILFVLCRYCVD